MSAHKKFQLKAVDRYMHPRMTGMHECTQRCLLAHFETIFDFRRSEFACTYKLIVMLLWASKFATANIECSFLWGYHLLIYCAVDGTYYELHETFMLFHECSASIQSVNQLTFIIGTQPLHCLGLMPVGES